MGDKYDYFKLLERARSKLPERVIRRERFEIPKADVIVEGRNTILRNFADIVSKLNRDQNHILQYLLRELGTAGVVDGRRAIFKRKLTGEEIDEKIDEYARIYVLCPECGRPDTVLVKEGRILMIECMACGAKRAISGKRVAKIQPRIDVRVGHEYDVLVEGVGGKGDGVAYIGDYTIFIPGVSRGSRVRVKIERISGKIAHGRVVR